jgi:hypothetical protein
MRFCSLCGAQVIAVQSAPQQYAAYPVYPAYPPMMVAPRVQKHLQTLGTLWCVFAAWRVIEGLIGAFFVKMFVFRRWHGDWPFAHHGNMSMPPWMHLMPIIAAATVLAALFAVFVGWSLLTRRTWGRVLGIVAAVLALFKFPLGTALGVYTLWVLAPAASALEYDAMAEPG